MTSRGRDGMGARLNVDCGFLHAWNSFVVLLLLLVLASGVPRDLRHGGLCGPKGSDSLINVLMYSHLGLSRNHLFLLIPKKTLVGYFEPFTHP